MPYFSRKTSILDQNKQPHIFNSVAVSCVLPLCEYIYLPAHIQLQKRDLDISSWCHANEKSKQTENLLSRNLMQMTMSQTDEEEKNIFIQTGKCFLGILEFFNAHITTALKKNQLFSFLLFLLSSIPAFYWACYLYIDFNNPFVQHPLNFSVKSSVFFRITRSNCLLYSTVPHLLYQ